MNYSLDPVMEEKLPPNLRLPNGLAGGDAPGADSALSLWLPAPVACSSSMDPQVWGRGACVPSPGVVGS